MGAGAFIAGFGRAAGADLERRAELELREKAQDLAHVRHYQNQLMRLMADPQMTATGKQNLMRAMISINQAKDAKAAAKIFEEAAAPEEQELIPALRKADQPAQYQEFPGFDVTNPQAQLAPFPDSATGENQAQLQRRSQLVPGSGEFASGVLGRGEGGEPLDVAAGGRMFYTPGEMMERQLHFEREAGRMQTEQAAAEAAATAPYKPVPAGAGFPMLGISMPFREQEEDLIEVKTVEDGRPVTRYMSRSDVVNRSFESPVKAGTEKVRAVQTVDAAGRPVTRFMREPDLVNRSFPSPSAAGTEKERTIGVRTVDEQGKSVTRYLPESEVVGRDFPTQATATERQVTKERENLVKVLDQLEEIAFGPADPRGKRSGGAFGGASNWGAWSSSTIGRFQGALAKYMPALVPKTSTYQSFVDQIRPTLARILGQRGNLNIVEQQWAAALMPTKAMTRDQAQGRMRLIRSILQSTEGDVKPQLRGSLKMMGLNPDAAPGMEALDVTPEMVDQVMERWDLSREAAEDYLRRWKTGTLED